MSDVKGRACSSCVLLLTLISVAVVVSSAFSFQLSPLLKTDHFVGNTRRHRHKLPTRNLFPLSDDEEKHNEPGPWLITPLREEGLPSSLPSIPALTALTMPMILIFLVPDSAAAFDHPVDIFHLNIPIPIPDYRYFLAGGLCAAASHGVTTPIDVIKTKIQADPQRYNQGFFDAARRISQEGDGTLLRGLGPTVIGYGIEGAAKFGLYESLKPIVANMLMLDSPAIPYLIASVVAGAAASIMLLPIERTRIRLVTDPDFASSLFTGIPKLVEESGVSGLFSGFSAMLSKQVPYTIGKQVSFDAFASLLYAAAASVSLLPADVKLEVSFGAALLASVLACILSHPGDVILTATYKGNEKSFNSVFSEIYMSRGVSGFFSGLSARFVHVGAIITSQLVLYDTVKQVLGLPATGS